ncbi:TRAP transporter small permease [Marispirochaeta sp.]|jgi:TRAP-type C4-dicarboxylate transport system permease small subunit|uniref:TRAP transporter small permease n=1 Tax=Marispirochaeta sp. TaxID=2038653 RepID=UPI0029C78FDB|nr:TRAP transporter small permease [Marispirochaeta sp.]
MSTGDTHPPRNNDNNNEKIQMENKDYDFRFRDYAIEDYFVLLVFWFLAAVVFAQFFTRYFLNSSIAWTEEVARYLLIATGFMGSVMAVRKRGHIYVEVFYRFLPPRVGRVMSTMVDIIKIIFFGVGMYLSFRIIPIMANQRMTALPYPMSYIYFPVLIGFVIMTIRSVQVAWEHWKSGYIPVINDSDHPLPEEIEQGGL